MFLVGAFLLLRGAGQVDEQFRTIEQSVGGPEQPAYHNAVLIVNTRLTPRNLLVALRDVEAVHARTREVRWLSAASIV